MGETWMKILSYDMSSRVCYMAMSCERQTQVMQCDAASAYVSSSPCWKKVCWLANLWNFLELDVDGCFSDLVLLKSWILRTPWTVNSLSCSESKDWCSSASLSYWFPPLASSVRRGSLESSHFSVSNGRRSCRIFQTLYFTLHDTKQDEPRISPPPPPWWNMDIRVL